MIVEILIDLDVRAREHARGNGDAKCLHMAAVYEYEC